MAKIAELADPFAVGARLPLPVATTRERRRGFIEYRRFDDILAEALDAILDTR
jgi:hypothetical protein